MSSTSEVRVQPEVAPPRPKPARLWNVVLLDDDEHTYDYVIEMLTQIFRHPAEMAYRMACEVDTTGRVIVATELLERAELRREQIHEYGPDWRIARSRSAMRAQLEPATD
jgi:ATP-dependent Clp protease adaptor protein ClpS